MTTASGLSKSFLCVAVLVSAFAMNSVFPTRSHAQECGVDCNRGGGGGNNNNWGEILNQIGKAAQEAQRRKAERDARRAEKRRRDAARRAAKKRRDAARRKAKRAAAERERKRKQAAKAERDRKRRQAEADKKAQADAADDAADMAADDDAGAATAAQGPEGGDSYETTVDGEIITIVRTPPPDWDIPEGAPPPGCVLKIGKFTLLCDGHFPERPPATCKGRTKNGCYLRSVNVPRRDGETAPACMLFCKPKPPNVTDNPPPKPKPPAVATGTATTYREPLRPKTPAVATGTATTYREPTRPKTPAVATGTATTYREPLRPQTPAVPTATAATSVARVEPPAPYAGRYYMCHSFEQEILNKIGEYNRQFDRCWNAPGADKLIKISPFRTREFRELKCEHLQVHMRRLQEVRMRRRKACDACASRAAKTRDLAAGKRCEIKAANGMTSPSVPMSECTNCLACEPLLRDELCRHWKKNQAAAAR